MPKPSETIYKISSAYSNGKYRGDFDFLNNKIEAIIQYLDEQHEAKQLDTLMNRKEWQESLDNITINQPSKVTHPCGCTMWYTHSHLTLRKKCECEQNNLNTNA